MSKIHTVTGFLTTAFLLQACNAGPNTPRPTTAKPTSSIQPINVSARDSEYIRMLEALNQRNPEEEAQQAMANGNRSVMGYYAGRAGLKIPGFNVQEQSMQTCTLTTLDGLGDVIYGENHLKYRVALRRFAQRYNIAMKPSCL